MSINSSSLNSPSTSQTKPITLKPQGYEFYDSNLNHPQFVVAPMVDGSELAWRILSRYYGAQLCYTPMIHSALFSEPKNLKYRQEQFDLESNEEGSLNLDRPLIAQFCSNDPQTFLKATRFITGDDQNPTHRVDAIDLNLGCPQGIAKKGKYGAFLMDHLDLINQIISHLHQHASVPITAKYRCFEDPDQTADYTHQLIKAGSQILTIHGRTRDQKGQFTGLADWKQITSVTQISHLHQIPILGNGNILIAKDALDMIHHTNVDGVMSAEGNLYNPAIFAPLNPVGIKTYRENLPSKFKTALNLIEEDYGHSNESLGSQTSLEHFPNSTKVASLYLAICRTLETRTATSAIKGHLYKLFRTVFETGRYNDLRESLASISWTSTRTNPLPSSPAPSKTRDQITYHQVLARFQEVVDAVRVRLEEDRNQGLLDETALDAEFEIRPDEKSDEYLRRLKIPYSRCQPYVRPLQALSISSIPLKSGPLSTSTHSFANHPDLLSASTKPIPLNSDGPEVFYGPVPCANPKGCLNSGAAKCRWTLCKTCCAAKTTQPSPSSRSELKTFSESEQETEEVCEIHEARAKLELERKAFKNEKRKKKLQAINHERNVKARSNPSPKMKSVELSQEIIS